MRTKVELALDYFHLVNFFNGCAIIFTCFGSLFLKSSTFQAELKLMNCTNLQRRNSSNDHKWHDVFINNYVEDIVAFFSLPWLHIFSAASLKNFTLLKLVRINIFFHIIMFNFSKTLKLFENKTKRTSTSASHPSTPRTITGALVIKL